MGNSVKNAATVLYVLLLGLLTAHVYHTPIYALDSLQYIGNALLMEETDVLKIHHRVYEELRQGVPDSAYKELAGEFVSPNDPTGARRDRAHNPYHYAEFLPLFAIRPLYNQTLWLLSRTGLSFVKSSVLVSTIAYFFIGIVLFRWLTRYAGLAVGSVMSLLLMMSPPLAQLGRETTSDALATLIAFLSLYLTFEKRSTVLGLTMLLASLFFRTDFVVLAGPVIAACWLERRIDFWKASVLVLLAIASVLCINHFAGDYGVKMLYYRNFVGVPLAPAEMSVRFAFRDYIAAFRAGITLVFGSYFLPFVLLGTVGVVSKRMRPVFLVSFAYVCLHFIALPNWQERWVGIFYLIATVCAATAVGLHPVDPTSE